MVINENELRFNPFTEFEFESLRLFHEQMEIINNCRIIKNDALKGSLHIEMNRDELKVDADFPNQDDIRSLLLLISPIVRSKERIHYEKIISILLEESANDGSRSYFETLKDDYKKSLSSGLRYGANGKEYGDDDIFNLLLNVCYFHFDDSMRKKLNDLKGLPHAADSALMGTLCVHISFLRFINKIISDYILTSNK